MESAIHSINTPPRLAAQASVMLITADYYGAIDSDMDLSSQDSMTRSCHHRLDQLPVVFAKAWDKQLDYAVAACRLHMSTTVIVRNLRLSRPVGCSKIILAQASTFACQTLHKFHGLVKKPIVDGFTATHTPRARALPKNAMRHALNAVFFLLKFTCFNRDCPDADRHQALQALNGTVEALTEWSVRPNDEAARSCAALRTKLEHSELWQSQHLQIDDRGSASILWDSIRRSCRHRSRAAPRIPDLLELMDPTRCIKDKTADVENIARSPALTDSTVEDLVWDDAILEFFDLGSFDQSALQDCAPVYGCQ
nr:hypothetical protein CFP56_46709 [Quercus suber]